MPHRVTQVSPEVYLAPDGTLRVTQVTPEVYSAGGGILRVTQLATEVYRTVAEGPLASGRVFIPSFLG